MNLAPRCQSIPDQTLPDFRTEFRRCWTIASSIQVKKEARSAAVDGWVGPGWKVAAWVSARQSGSRAIGRQPSAPGWTRWRRLRLAARMAGTCCLEPAPASEPRLRLPAGGDQLSEDTIVDRWTADHPATQPGKLFTTQPTLLLFARSYIKVHTLFQFS